LILNKMRSEFIEITGACMKQNVHNDRVERSRVLVKQE